MRFAILLSVLFFSSAIAFGCPACGGVDASIGDRPEYYLGNTDESGHFMVWFKLAEIGLSNTKLPVYLSYNAGERRSGTIFGTGWDCPSLESRIFPLSEKRLALTLLGGRTETLYRGSEKIDEFTSRDTFWKAVKLGSDRFQITGPGKSEFFYESGRIIGAKIGDDQLKWIYSSDGISSLLRNGSAIIELRKNAGEAKPSTIFITGKTFKLSYQKLPIFAALNGIPTIAGFSESLSKIESEKKSLDMPIVPSEDGVAKATIVDSEARGPRQYSWNGVTGLLNSDGMWNYTVLPSKTTSRFIVSRVDQKGNLESYESTPVVTKHIMPGGLIRYRSFIKMAGPGYGKPRADIIKDSKNNIVTSTQWSYDEKWQLLRRIADKEIKEWFRDKDGLLIKETTNYAGNLVGEITYDDTGRVLTRKDGKDFFTYAYGKDGVVVKRFYDGKLQNLIAKSSNGLQTYFPPTASIDPNKITSAIESAVGKSGPGQLLEKAISSPAIPGKF